MTTDRPKPRHDGHKKGRHGKRADDQEADAPTREMLGLLRPAAPGFVEAEGPMERTVHATQDTIAAAVPVQAAARRFDLSFPRGIQTYGVDYGRDGRTLLLSGSRGHVAVMDWEAGRLSCELQLDEAVRDACLLHGAGQLFAVAQRRFVYVYDASAGGAEVHRLRQHAEPEHMFFLPYHFLLASIGPHGVLRYTDVTTGAIAGEVPTMLGRCRALVHNPATAIAHAGFAGGVVALYTPTVRGPLVTMKCHSSPITALAVDPAGTSMVTAGADGIVRVWDLRTYRKRHEFHPSRPATALAISQRGVLAAAHGAHVSMWRDALEKRTREPYLAHIVPGEVVGSLRFCPHQDVLGAGHTAGFSSLLVPGAGDPSLDAFEAANPFATRSQRREVEVRRILEKLPVETIVLDPASAIGTVARTNEERVAANNALAWAANHEQGATRDPAAVAARKAKRIKARAARRSNIVERPKEDAFVVVRPQGADAPRERTPLDRFRLSAAALHRSS